MKALFFDTSCDLILVGIYTITETSVTQDYFYSGNHPREASFRLVSDIEKGLQQVNLEKPEVIICCSGPGSFTGIRISVTTARNLSQIWKIPVLGIDTIEMYSKFYADFYNASVITAIDGKQKKVFAGYSSKGIYKGTFDILPNDISTFFKSELEEEQVVIVSDTPLLLPSHDFLSLLPNPMPILHLKISQIINLNLTENNYSSLLPKYMRESYAKKPLV